MIRWYPINCISQKLECTYYLNLKHILLNIGDKFACCSPKVCIQNLQGRLIVEWLVEGIDR